MRNIKRCVVNNKVCIWLYDTKNYFEIGSEVVSFVTGKLPLLMSLYYFYQNRTYVIENPFILILCVIGFFMLSLLGLLWKRIGFYDVERYSEAKIHPVNKEILEAARRINNGER